jgi:hypothetical protein
MARKHVVRRVGVGAPLVLAAEPAAATTAAVGVSVGRGRAETLLALVVAGEEDLKQDGDQEEAAALVSMFDFWGVRCSDLHSDDGDRKRNLLQHAGHAKGNSRVGLVVARAFAERGVDLALAGLRAVACEHSDGDHDTDEADIERDRDKGEKGDTAKTAGQDGAQQSIEGGRARHALDSLNPSVDLLVIVGESGQVVGEDAEDDGGVEALEDTNGEV